MISLTVAIGIKRTSNETVGLFLFLILIGLYGLFLMVYMVHFLMVHFAHGKHFMVYGLILMTSMIYS